MVNASADDFLVVAKRPKYKQPGKNGMLVRVRSQDYIDLVRVCDEANVRLCDLIHAVIRYAMDHLRIEDEGGEHDEYRRDGCGAG